MKTNLILLINHIDINPLGTTNRLLDYTSRVLEPNLFIAMFAHVGHNKFYLSDQTRQTMFGLVVVRDYYGVLIYDRVIER